MKIYRITIQGDKYPTEYTVNGSSWRSAIGRAIQEYQKRFKGKHTSELKIKAIRGGELLETALSDTTSE